MIHKIKIRTQQSRIGNLNGKLKNIIYTRDTVIDAHLVTIEEHKDTITVRKSHKDTSVHD